MTNFDEDDLVNFEKKIIEVKKMKEQLRKSYFLPEIYDEFVLGLDVMTLIYDIKRCKLV